MANTMILGEAKAVAWSRASTSVAVGSTDLSLKVLDIVKKEVICSFDEVIVLIHRQLTS
mgnify:CR=1 FL=1